ncbi:MAG: 3-methyl-2-oxobutanoate dehydrogenase subunit beta, partial [Deltaproteobacteria bacterium]|nr:3-methyl-2-oxobutanoate dehydrogenase subunit beta [Deltaproteobacteria bacterium]
LKGRGDGPSRYQASLILDSLEMERHNWKLVRKYKEIAEQETLFELYMMDDAEFAVVAYGTTARIAKGAIKRARKEGLKVGLVRPITLFPFPDKILQKVAQQIKNFLVFEMSTGQMVEDVRLALEHERVVIDFHGRPGGIIPTPIEFSRVIHRYYRRM